MPAIDELPDDLAGSTKTYTLTYPAAAETLNSTPPDLPTSFPGTAQFSHTVVIGDLPTIAPAPLTTPKYHALMVLAGHNTSGTDRMVTCMVERNSALLSAPDHVVSSGAYWTLNAFAPAVTAGDSLTIFAQASDGGVTWDYQAYAMMVDEYQLAPPDRLLARVTYTLMAHPLLTLGTPTVEDTGPFHIQHLGLMGGLLSAATTCASQVQRSSMGAGWCHYGHQAHTAAVLSRTSRPAYFRNMVPSAITFTLTDITV